MWEHPALCGASVAESRRWCRLASSTCKKPAFPKFSCFQPQASHLKLSDCLPSSRKENLIPNLLSWDTSQTHKISWVESRWQSPQVRQFFSYISPSSAVTLGVLTVRILRTGARRGVRLIRCYFPNMHSPRDLRSAESGGPARVLFETAFLLWCRAHFRAW